MEPPSTGHPSPSPQTVTELLKENNDLIEAKSHHQHW